MDKETLQKHQELNKIASVPFSPQERMQVLKKISRDIFTSEELIRIMHQMANFELYQKAFFKLQKENRKSLADKLHNLADEIGDIERELYDYRQNEY